MMSTWNFEALFEHLEKELGAQSGIAVEAGTVGDDAYNRLTDGMQPPCAVLRGLVRYNMHASRVKVFTSCDTRRIPCRLPSTYKTCSLKQTIVFLLTRVRNISVHMGMKQRADGHVTCGTKQAFCTSCP
jgi:hypothetical protein